MGYLRITYGFFDIRENSVYNLLRIMRFVINLLERNL